MIKKLLLSLLLLGTLIYAETPTDSSITKQYIATFDRAPDADGLRYWLNAKLTMEEIATSLFEQPEAQERYPDGFSNEDFIIEVYINLFDHLPDDRGFDYWLVRLESETICRPLFILAVINGALGDDAKILTNKTVVGLAFAKDGRNDIDETFAVMENVTADKDSVNETLCKFSLPGCILPPPPPPPPPPFITKWSIPDSSLTLKFSMTANASFSINWGDGSVTIFDAATTSASHTYDSGGDYTVSISSRIRSFKADSSASKLISVVHWSSAAWTTMVEAFKDCSHPDFGFTATDIPNLSGVTSMTSMFENAQAFNSPIGNWNTSSVTDMGGMFANTWSFNMPIGDWDTSRVTNMRGMFLNTRSFNMPIGDWDTSRVTDMSYMFVNSRLFNSPIGAWDVSSVTNIDHMFYTSNPTFTIFNQDLSSWVFSIATTNVNCYDCGADDWEAVNKPTFIP